MTNETIRARLRSYHAVEERSVCERFLVAHRAACDRHNMKSLTSLNAEWFDNPLVWFTTLESADDGELLAGIRVQISDELHQLPAEQAYPGPDLREFVRDSRDAGLCELCGGWASPRGAHTGAFNLIVMSAMALAAPLGARRVLVAVGGHTLPVAIEYGMLLEPRLADQGRFFYPTPDKRAFLAVNPDTWSMETATPSARQAVHDVRLRPRQHFVQQTGAYTIHAEVDLDIRAVPLAGEHELLYARAR
jgi:hypothetical protein